MTAVSKFSLLLMHSSILIIRLARWDKITCYDIVLPIGLSTLVRDCLWSAWFKPTMLFHHVSSFLLFSDHFKDLFEVLVTTADRLFSLKLSSFFVCQYLLPLGWHLTVNARPCIHRLFHKLGLNTWSEVLAGYEFLWGKVEYWLELWLASVDFDIWFVLDQQHVRICCLILLLYRLPLILEPCLNRCRCLILIDG